MADFKYRMNVPVNGDVTLCDVETTFKELMKDVREVPGRSLVIVPLDAPITEKDKRAVLADYQRIGKFVWDSNFIDLFDGHLEHEYTCAYVRDVEYYPAAMSVDTLVTPVMSKENMQSVVEVIRSEVDSKVEDRELRGIVVLLPNLHEDMRFQFRNQVHNVAPIGIEDIYLINKCRE